MKQLVESNRVYGVLAYQDEDNIPVGWASIDRKQTLPGHDCIGSNINCSKDIWSIHCVTSRPDMKNRGVEKALTNAAVEFLKTMKASKVTLAKLQSFINR